MAENQNFENLIAEAAAQPKSYENDGEKIETHSLGDLVAAAKFRRQCKAGRNPFRSLGLAKISTEGPQP